MTEPPESHPPEGEPKPAPPGTKMQGVRVPPGESEASVSSNAAPAAARPATPEAGPASPAPAAPRAVAGQEGAPAPPASPAAAKAAVPVSPKPAPAAAAKPVAHARGEGKAVVPGYAAKLAKGGEAEQEPLVGSADFGWNVFHLFMMLGLIALTAIVLVSCGRMLMAWFSIF